LWARGLRIGGTAGARNLADLGCLVPPDDGALRFVPMLSLFGRCGPAMLAQITDIHDAQDQIGLLATWLRADGRRGERRVLGRARGGVIRLLPCEGHAELWIATDVETACAAACQGAGAWSVLSADGLANFPVVPQGTSGLVIVAGSIPVGGRLPPAGECLRQEHIAACWRRWRDAGAPVRGVTPRLIAAGKARGAFHRGVPCS
jgi:hypothetical protein